MGHEEKQPWRDRITCADLVGNVVMSQYIGPLAAELDSASWRSGTLRPFESIGSLGAKYIYLNRIKQREFRLLLLSFLPSELNSSVPTLDQDGFKLKAFAALLSEPISVLSTMSVRNFITGASVRPLVESQIREWSVDVLRFCPKCMEEGYHSILHQMPCFDECIFHFEPLQSHGDKLGSVGKFPQDLRLIPLLYKLWFESSAYWPQARTSFWPTYLEDEEKKTFMVKQLKNQLRRVDCRLSKKFESQPIIDAQSSADRLILTSHLAGAAGEKLRALMRTNDDAEHLCRYTVVASHRQKAFIMGTNVGTFQDICYLRLHTYAHTSDTPKWKSVLNLWLKKTEGNHQSCVQAFDGLYRRWRHGPRQVWHRSDYPPCVAALRPGWLPCLELLLSETFRQVFLKECWEHDYLLRKPQFDSYPLDMMQVVHARRDVAYPPLIGDVDRIEWSNSSSLVCCPVGPLAELCDIVLLWEVWSWIRAAMELRDSIDKALLMRFSESPELLTAMLQTLARRYKPSYAYHACDKGVAVIGLLRFPFVMSIPRKPAGHKKSVLKQIQAIDAALYEEEQGEMLALSSYIHTILSQPVVGKNTL